MHPKPHYGNQILELKINHKLTFLSSLMKATTKHQKSIGQRLQMDLTRTNHTHASHKTLKMVKKKKTQTEKS